VGVFARSVPLVAHKSDFHCMESLELRGSPGAWREALVNPHYVTPIRQSGSKFLVNNDLFAAFLPLPSIRPHQRSIFSIIR
jgi:hypothetical protein